MLSSPDLLAVTASSNSDFTFWSSLNSCYSFRYFSLEAHKSCPIWLTLEQACNCFSSYYLTLLIHLFSSSILGASLSWSLNCRYSSSFRAILSLKAVISFLSYLLLLSISCIILSLFWDICRTTSFLCSSCFSIYFIVFPNYSSCLWNMALRASSSSYLSL